MEEIAAARNFDGEAGRRADLGTCEECRTGRDDTGVEARRRDDRTGVRARCPAHRDRDRTQRPRVLQARGDAHAGRPRPLGVPEAGGGGERASRHAREALRRTAGDRSAARVAADVPVLQGRGQRHLRRGRRGAWTRRRRSRRAAHRHPMRARLAQLLQEIRRALRGLGRQAHLPRVRR